MKQFIYYDIHGEIKQVIKFADMVDPIHPEDLHLMKVDRDLLASDLVNKYVSEGILKDKSPSPEGPFWSWQPDNTWSFQREKFMSHIREMRNLKLSECDWTQANDSPLSDEKKLEWYNYREALRNLPSEITTQQSIEDIPWPTEPS